MSESSQHKHTDGFKPINYRFFNVTNFAIVAAVALVLGICVAHADSETLVPGQGVVEPAPVCKTTDYNTLLQVAQADYSPAELVITSDPAIVADVTNFVKTKEYSPLIASTDADFTRVVKIIVVTGHGSETGRKLLLGFDKYDCTVLMDSYEG